MQIEQFIPRPRLAAAAASDQLRLRLGLRCHGPSLKCRRVFGQKGKWPKKDFGRAVSRILSALLRAERIICLSSQYPEPVRVSELEAGRFGSLFGLAPDGVFRARPISRPAVVSYTTFSPLPESDRRWYHRPTRAVCFLWHFPSKCFHTFRPHISRSCRNGLRGVAPCGVRTFLLRLAPKAILHSSKIAASLSPPRRPSKTGSPIGAAQFRLHKIRAARVPVLRPMTRPNRPARFCTTALRFNAPERFADVSVVLVAPAHNTCPLFKIKIFANTGRISST